MTAVNGNGHLNGNGHDTSWQSALNGHDTVAPLRGADDRELPELPLYDTDCEQRVLGTLLIDNNTYSRVATRLRPDHFSSALHGRIYEAIAAQIERGAVANPVTMKYFLNSDPGLIKAGKPADQYLAQLVRAATDSTSAVDYAEIVVALAQRREADIACQNYRDARRQSWDAGEHIARLRDALNEIERRARHRQPFTLDELLAKVTIKSWINRDIPPLDPLLGDMLTTTTRMMLVAPTGLGKTNIALAMAVAVALGRDFMHWRGAGRPRRVLYVDGEMSQRLMKQRIMDAARREDLSEESLAALQANLFVVNHADFDLQPLNTTAGQKFIDELIAHLGRRFDLVVFDNIQALTIGDPLDPAECQQVLPWAKTLTNRQIGQLWIHHTGHDESHAYGPKLREWQFDSVALLERVERPEADIAFKTNFLKARERTPDNRADFDEAFVTLANDTWSSERRGEQSRAKRPAPDRVFELLQDEIVRHGTIPPFNGLVPSNTPCVKEEWWRQRCKHGCISDGDPDPVKKGAADRQAFYRAAKKLLDGGIIGKCDEWIWVVPDPGQRR
jgi:hypothetical protein